MAMYTVKIVDHTKSDEFQKYKGGIKRLAQERFDEAFKDASDTVTVSWGNGTEKDDLVMHFVQTAYASASGGRNLLWRRARSRCRTKNEHRPLWVPRRDRLSSFSDRVPAAFS